MRNTCKVLGIFPLLVCGILGVASAQVFTTVATFNRTNGASPGFNSLAQDFDGSLNGTTVEGGKDFGVTFRLTKSNELIIVNEFDSMTNGAYPNGVILASDGNSMERQWVPTP